MNKVIKYITLMLISVMCLGGISSAKADHSFKMYSVMNNWGLANSGFEWEFGSLFSVTTQLYKMNTAYPGSAVIVSSTLIGSNLTSYQVEENTKYVFRVFWPYEWYENPCIYTPMPDYCGMGPRTPLVLEYYDIQWPWNDWVYDYVEPPYPPAAGQYTYYVDYEFSFFMYYENWWNPLTDMVTDIRYHKLGEGRGTLAQKTDIVSRRFADPYTYYK